MRPRTQRRGPYSRGDVVADRVVGALAWGSRLGVLAYAASTLVSDHHAPAIASEAVGLLASAVHFFARNFVIVTDLAQEMPLTKLGGPMSGADSSMAVLVSFVASPVLAPHDGRFEATGRMLVGVLVATTVVPRLFLSASACALMATTVTTRKTYYPEMLGYQTVLAVAAALWILQAASVAFSLSAFFVRPAAYSLARVALVGEHDLTPHALFLGVLLLSVPSLNKAVLRISAGSQRSASRPTTRTDGATENAF